MTTDATQEMASVLRYIRRCWSYQLPECVRAEIDSALAKHNAASAPVLTDPATGNQSSPIHITNTGQILREDRSTR